MTPEYREHLIEIVTPAIDALAPDETVVCKQLFPAKLWDLSEESVQQAYGRHISRLVAEKALPLEPYGFSSKRHNQYRRT